MKSLSLSVFLSSLAVAQSTQRFLQGQERTRIFLRYGGIRGRRMARRCASAIFQDYPDDDVIIMNANSTCLKSLQDYDDIIEIDYDNEVGGLGMFDGFWEDAFSRALAEVTAWNIQMIQADKVSTGDHEVTVCIVDSGVSSAHPEFTNENFNGTDTVKFYGNPWPWGSDGVGHGTHVAGIIAASSGNNEGIGSLGGNLKVHITRALDDDGKGYESDIRNAVEQCVEAGAKVINLSLGGPYMASKSAEFYTRFVNEYGVFMTAAAGNDGNTNKVYPAAHPQIVSVSAVTESGVRWPGASYGDQTELSAPGRKILSTYVFDVAVRMDETGFGHMASAVEGAPKGPVTGILRLCDSTDSKCASTGNGDICLYEKEPEDQINDLANKCVAGNGGGMIVFSSNGSPYSTWRTTSSSIPIVAVKTSIGSELTQMNLGEQVTILGDAGGNSPEYSYAYLTGTSMATPHVAAAAALLWTHFPECTNHQIRYALAVTARHPNGEHACDDHIGYGVIQVKDAFDWLYKDPCNSWQVSQTSSGGCTTLHQ